LALLAVSSGASTNTEHPKLRFVPLSGFLSPSAVFSAPRLCELSHPHTTSRVPLPVQGLSVSWLPSLIDPNFPPCRFLTFVLPTGEPVSKPRPRDSEVFYPTERRTTKLFVPPGCRNRTGYLLRGSQFDTDAFATISILNLLRVCGFPRPPGSQWSLLPSPRRSLP
jgi:hypothetical protein